MDKKRKTQETEKEIKELRNRRKKKRRKEVKLKKLKRENIKYNKLLSINGNQKDCKSSDKQDPDLQAGSSNLFAISWHFPPISLAIFRTVDDPTKTPHWTHPHAASPLFSQSLSRSAMCIQHLTFSRPGLIHAHISITISQFSNLTQSAIN